MNAQELQYILQIMNNADIKGQNSVFHAQLMSKLSLEMRDRVQEELPNANGNSQKTG